MLRRWRKPLVVLTPKMMLRHPSSASRLQDFSEREFERVRVAPGSSNADLLLVCSGKILHELARERERRGRDSAALISIEELYPLPEAELTAAFGAFASAKEIRWVQEEPENMGARATMAPLLDRLRGGRALRWVSRPAGGSPATGSSAIHAREQAELIDRAFEAVRPLSWEP
jgi:2-oxoglutarate dehydrogenase E1 component